VDNPLENDVECSPEEEVRDSEPGEPLQNALETVSEQSTIVFGDRPSDPVTTRLPGYSAQLRRAGRRH
jgi:hypothetical protein